MRAQQQVTTNNYGTFITIIIASGIWLKLYCCICYPLNEGIDSWGGSWKLFPLDKLVVLRILPAEGVRSGLGEDQCLSQCKRGMGMGAGGPFACWLGLPAILRLLIFCVAYSRT